MCKVKMGRVWWVLVGRLCGMLNGKGVLGSDGGGGRIIK